MRRSPFWRAKWTRWSVSRVLSDVRPSRKKDDRETAIPLDRPSRDGSRDLPGPSQPVTAYPTRGRRGVPIRSCSRRGLPCRPCCQVRGGLLPHPFTLTGLARPEVCFLWRYPSGRPGRKLSAAFSPWSPDFPRRDQVPPRPPSRLAGARCAATSRRSTTSWARPCAAD